MLKIPGRQGSVQDVQLWYGRPTLWMTRRGGLVLVAESPDALSSPLAGVRPQASTHSRGVILTTTLVYHNVWFMLGQ